MEEDEGVYLNAHSSPTKDLYPDLAGETVSRQLHILNTNTAVHQQNTVFQLLPWKQTNTHLQKTIHRAWYLLA